MKYIALFALMASPAFAHDPMIDGVDVYGNRFDVTITHDDSGWDHYADGWEVLDADGNSLGMRELLHPHENEQPFTRSLSGVDIPEGMTEVYVRARCSVDGWSEDLFKVLLPE